MSNATNMLAGKRRIVTAIAAALIVALAVGVLIGALTDPADAAPHSAVSEQRADAPTVRNAEMRVPATDVDAVAATRVAIPAAASPSAEAIPAEAAPATAATAAGTRAQVSGQAVTVGSPAPVAAPAPVPAPNQSSPAPIAIVVPHVPSTPSTPINAGPTPEQIADQIARDAQRQAEQNYDPSQNQTAG